MKVVVTAEGNDLSAKLDPRFGRAQFLLLVDTDTGEFESFDNSLNLNSMQGAGIQTAQNVANMGAKAIVTGNVGPKAFNVLNMSDIKIYLVTGGTVAEAVDKFKNGAIQEVSQANVQGHW